MMFNENQSRDLKEHGLENVALLSWTPHGEVSSITATGYEKTRLGLLLQLRTVHHGRLALVRCQLQNARTSYLVG